MGNPHYLSDPINGLKVAGLIRDRLSQLRPGSKAEFQKRYQEFHARIGAAMFGQELAGVYDPLKLAELADHGKLELFLQQQGQAGLLGGWAARFKPHRGARIVADHNMWVYLTDRCGVQVAGFMEPKPGLSPTTAHLAWVVEQMKQSGVRVVITGAYFDPKHARFLAQQTGAKTVVLAHQAGALPGTEDYLSMIEHNMSALAAALNGGP
jgi:zinc/manganese transport system substrate-binding protein